MLISDEGSSDFSEEQFFQNLNQKNRCQKTMEKERESRIYNRYRDSLPTDREEDASKSIWSRDAISRQGNEVN